MTSTVERFRTLSASEAEDFRKWARENEPPTPGLWDSYHPECRAEWLKQGIMQVKKARDVCEEAASVLEALKGQHSRTDLVNMLRCVALGIERSHETPDELL